jgi:hypothetical protein
MEGRYGVKKAGKENGKKRLEGKVELEHTQGR